jgi:GT2 family glycosyltransferase
MDTICDREALAQLEQTAVDNPLAGSVQARLMLWEDQAKINSLGNATHYLGFGFCLGYKDNYQASLSSNKTVKKIFYASGAAVLFKAQTLRKIGLFDEVFWMYAEDQDLGWRIWLTGQECVLATEAVVFHKYEFTRSASRYYWIDRNRFLVILKNYRLATLILVLPALIVMEFGQLYFALTTGWFGEKMRVYQYLFKPASWRYIFRERKKIQALRQVKDREIRHLLVSTIEYQEIASWPLRVANVIFSLYWRIIKPLIIW